MNVVAIPDLLRAVEGCTLLIFVVPHQFVERICHQLVGRLVKGARAISLVKGIDCERGDLELVSTRINTILSLDVSVLMGANLANDIAKERFSEATIGFKDHINAAIWRDLFDQPYFKISLVEDVTGVELCGALKNIIAFAAGFIDGLFPEGEADNTKAAIMRRGLLEMRALCRLFDSQVRDETFFESCGLADIITSCYGGRNRRVAEAFVRTGKSLEVLEEELLKGQKLQGPPTASSVYKWLEERELTDRFPIMSSVYRICFEGRNPNLFLDDISK
jgi:glycerol-3-phosphate dehydrogenase (NAD+)